MSDALPAVRATELSAAELVTEARAELERITDPVEIKEIRDRAEAMKVYAEAKGRREDALAAAEIRLWAERRAGEMRRALPYPTGAQPARFDWDQARRLLEEGLSQRNVAKRCGVTPSAVGRARKRGWRPSESQRRAFDVALGITPGVAIGWMRLAVIPVDVFSTTIERIKIENRELTPGTVVNRARGNDEKLEDGIWRAPTGRLRIRWTDADGDARVKTLKTRSLVQAQRQRERLQRAVSVHLPRSDPLGSVYADVRRLLGQLDGMLPRFESEARVSLENAMQGLYRAEDGIVRASKLTAVKTPRERGGVYYRPAGGNLTGAS